MVLTDFLAIMVIAGAACARATLAAVVGARRVGVKAEARATWVFCEPVHTSDLGGKGSRHPCRQHFCDAPARCTERTSLRTAPSPRRRAGAAGAGHSRHGGAHWQARRRRRQPRRRQRRQRCASRAGEVGSEVFVLCSLYPGGTSSSDPKPTLLRIHEHCAPGKNKTSPGGGQGSKVAGGKLEVRRGDSNLRRHGTPARTLRRRHRVRGGAGCWPAGPAAARCRAGPCGPCAPGFLGPGGHACRSVLRRRASGTGVERWPVCAGRSRSDHPSAAAGRRGSAVLGRPAPWRARRDSGAAAGIRRPNVEDGVANPGRW
jgi:hypothetical protein